MNARNLTILIAWHSDMLTREEATRALGLPFEAPLAPLSALYADACRRGVRSARLELKRQRYFEESING